MSLPIGLNLNNITFNANQKTRDLNAALMSNPSVFMGATFNSNPINNASLFFQNPTLSSFNGFGGLSNPFASMLSNCGLFNNLNLPAFNLMSTNFSTNFNMFPSLGQLSLSFASMTSRMSMSSFGTSVRPSVTLTSDKAQNAIRLATSEIGTAEIGTSNNSAGVNKYRGGVANGQAWCASFVSWCYGQGQNSNNSKTFGYTASSQEIKRKAIQAGHYSDKNSGYTPVAGDIAVWTKPDGAHGHVGIVSQVYSDGSFDVIEGNNNQQVRKVRRTTSVKDFAGFVRMNEWLEA